MPRTGGSGSGVAAPGSSREWLASRGEPMDCPYCGSAKTERAAMFGPFHMSETYVCRACGSPFSRIKWNGDGPAANGREAKTE
jgi:DNA-directed RNA polymerase subunit RPC12/RpoP